MLQSPHVKRFSVSFMRYFNSCIVLTQILNTEEHYIQQTFVHWIRLHQYISVNWLQPDFTVQYCRLNIAALFISLLSTTYSLILHFTIVHYIQSHFTFHYCPLHTDSFNILLLFTSYTLTLNKTIVNLIQRNYQVLTTVSNSISQGYWEVGRSVAAYFIWWVDCTVYYKRVRLVLSASRALKAILYWDVQK